VRKNKNGKKRSTIEKLGVFVFVFLITIILALSSLFFYPNNMTRYRLAYILAFAAFFGSLFIISIIIWLTAKQESQNTRRNLDTHLFHAKNSKLEDDPSQAPPHYKIGDDGEIVEVKEKAKRS
jgi:hypothetical protein